MRTDIFNLHSVIVNDYQSYIQSFININDPEIRDVVEGELEKGKLWPELGFQRGCFRFGEVFSMQCRQYILAGLGPATDLQPNTRSRRAAGAPAQPAFSLLPGSR
jgi:hypothetical protein